MIGYITDKNIRDKNMEGEELKLIGKLMKFDWYRTIYEAAFSFYKTIMGNDVTNLTRWLETYENSAIAELKSLLNGVKKDLEAIQNAIKYDVSNGVVEGSVNKLKTVKRIMYGRASVELLRIKMVFGDLCFN